MSNKRLAADDLSYALRAEWHYQLGAVSAATMGLALVGLSFGGFVFPHHIVLVLFGVLATSAVGLARAWLGMTIDGHVGLIPAVATAVVVIAALCAASSSDAVWCFGPLALVGFPLGLLVIDGPIRVFALFVLAIAGVVVAAAAVAGGTGVAMGVGLVVACNGVLAFVVAFTLPSWRTKPARY